MKVIAKIAVIAVFTFGVLALIGGSGCSKPTEEQSGSQTKQYTCTMHPDVVRDKPGKCPKCGMDLVEKR